jgi:hypothetical protein
VQVGVVVTSRSVGVSGGDGGPGQVQLVRLQGRSPPESPMCHPGRAAASGRRRSRANPRTPRSRPSMQRRRLIGRGSNRSSSCILSTSSSSGSASPSIRVRRYAGVPAMASGSALISVPEISAGADPALPFPRSGACDRRGRGGVSTVLRVTKRAWAISGLRRPSADSSATRRTDAVSSCTPSLSGSLDRPAAALSSMRARWAGGV